LIRKRCSRCGKKQNLLKDGTIAGHDARIMGSKLCYMSRPDLDDYVTKTQCPGSWEHPHKGRWCGEIGFVR
jgi:hypothetical protein